MGCTQSKIENEEAVTRCKDRKQFMKDAVSARNTFAAAHSAYAIALKNTGAALSDYTHAEVSHHPSLKNTDAVPPTTTSVDSLPPPPPPLPNFPPQAPLHRAVSMPEMKIPKPESKPVAPTIMEEEEMEFEAQDNEKLIRKRSSSNRGSGSNRGGVQENHHMEQGPPQPTPPQQRWKEDVMRASTEHQGSSWGDYIFASADSMLGPSLAETVVVEEKELGRKEFEEKANRVPQEDEEEEEEEEPVVVEEKKVEKAVEVPVPVPVLAVEKKASKKGNEVVRRVGKPTNLIQLFAELDDHFLKASESAHEVSKMMEATRLHYHSNFADNRGNMS